MSDDECLIPGHGHVITDPEASEPPRAQKPVNWRACRALGRTQIALGTFAFMLHAAGHIVQKRYGHYIDEYAYYWQTTDFYVIGQGYWAAPLIIMSGGFAVGAANRHTRRSLRASGAFAIIASLISLAMLGLTLGCLRYDVRRVVDGFSFRNRKFVTYPPTTTTTTTTTEGNHPRDWYPRYDHHYERDPNGYYEYFEDYAANYVVPAWVALGIAVTYTLVSVALVVCTIRNCVVVFDARPCADCRCSMAPITSMAKKLRMRFAKRNNTADDDTLPPPGSLQLVGDQLSVQPSPSQLYHTSCVCSFGKYCTGLCHWTINGRGRTYTEVPATDVGSDDVDTEKELAADAGNPLVDV